MLSDSLLMPLPDAQLYKLSRRALRQVAISHNDSLKVHHLSLIANNFYKVQDWPSFNETTQAYIEVAAAIHDSSELAKAYRFKAEYYKNLSSFDSAFYFYTKSEKLYKKLKDNINLGKIYLRKGTVQFYANDYLGADISTSQAYNLLRNSEDKQTIYQVTSMMGIIANEMKDYPKAIQKHGEALQIVRDYSLTSLNQEATSLNNIGYSYQNANEDAKAIDSFTAALQDKSLRNKVPDLYAILLDNLAYSKFKLNDFEGLPQLFFNALHVRDSLRLSSGRVISNLHLSEFYARNKDTARAKTFGEMALIIAKQANASGDLLAALKQLSAVDRQKASNYTQQYIKISDSLQNAERSSQNKLARIQVETDEIIQQKDRLEEQNRSLLYYFVGTLMIGILLFVIRAQRARNRELLLKQAQQKANEDIYNLMISQQNKIEESRIKEKKRIAQELHDGVLGRLFGTRLNLDSLNKVTDETAIRKRVTYLKELKNIEQDIREISHDLNREKYVLINNFLAILTNLIEEQKSLFPTEVALTVDESIQWDFISNSLKINFYRIIQEGLQNINKYANARRVYIGLHLVNHNLYLKISDDGVGFNVENKRKGIGLQNMMARVQELNGTMQINSQRGQGTTIEITVMESPINHSHEN